MTTQLVNSLTVDELKEVIASVVDARLNIFLSFIKEDQSKTFELHMAEFLSEYEQKVTKARSSLEYVENILESKVEVKKENPWLKIAGMHKDNPELFEEVVAHMEESRQEILDQEVV